MISEQECRREDWIEGVPILLENDEEWQFPKPVMQLRLSLGGGQVGHEFVPASTDTNRRFSQAYFDEMDAFRETIVNLPAPDEPVEGERVTGLDLTKMGFSLAANLLRRNYTLTDDEVAELLQGPVGDPRTDMMWVAIRDVALGIAPKAAPAA